MPFDQAGAAPQWFEATELSPNMGLSGEGYLICRNVPLARIGVQRYHGSEIPVPAGADGFVDVDRPEREIFDPVSIASFEGKPVTLDHPMTNIGPWNWRQHAVGHVQHVRRGEGAQADLLIGDLLITDPQAIDAIRSGLRGVSVGYDANYDTFGPGRARQRDIRANHIALVSEPRCGPRCAIGDSIQTNKRRLPSTQPMNVPMKPPPQRDWRTMARQREQLQYWQEAAINTRHAEFWSRRENQGKS
jgi:uncharacterized protein